MVFSKEAFLLLLIKEIGQPLAKKIMNVIGNQDPSHLSQALENASKGMTAMLSLEKAFGKEFYKIIDDALDFGGGPFVYQAGCSNYIKLETTNTDIKEILEMLRMELNINLDRIAKTHKNDAPEGLSYFNGLFGEWKNRYEYLIGITKEEESVFILINEMLDGKKRNIRQIFELLRRTVLGVGGALLVIHGVLLAMGVGVGIIKAFLIFLEGIPVVQVGAFIMSGVVLAALAFYKVKEKDVMTACIFTAYKIIDRRKTIL